MRNRYLPIWNDLVRIWKKITKVGINIRVILDTHVVHHYYEFNRSINSENFI